MRGASAGFSVLLIGGLLAPFLTLVSTAAAVVIGSLVGLVAARRSNT